MSNTEKQANTLSTTLAWFQEARPTVTDKQLHTQMGVHFEEVGEMIDEISPRTAKANALLSNARVALKALADYLKESDGVVYVNKQNSVDLLDAICDQIVTGVGVAHHLGFSVVEALDEVNRSNFSKFVDGKAIVDQNGKVAKGPGYFKANLAPYVPSENPVAAAPELIGS